MADLPEVPDLSVPLETPPGSPANEADVGLADLLEPEPMDMPTVAPAADAAATEPPPGELAETIEELLERSSDLVLRQGELVQSVTRLHGALQETRDEVLEGMVELRQIVAAHGGSNVQDAGEPPWLSRVLASLDESETRGIRLSKQLQLALTIALLQFFALGAMGFVMWQHVGKTAAAPAQQEVESPVEPDSEAVDQDPAAKQKPVKKQRRRQRR